MMRYTELIAAHADWQALVLGAGIEPARALLGHAASTGWERWLVAESVPECMPLPEVIQRCHEEDLGLLELWAELTAEQAAARLSHLAQLLPETSLVVITTNPSLAAWQLQAGDAGVIRLDHVHVFPASNVEAAAPWLKPYGAAEPGFLPHPRLQRQVAALGEAGQYQLHRLSVAVVGCGGTGGLLAQLLALVGVGHLLLIDHDRIEQVNRNRLVAATDADVRRGTFKVEALRRHLRSLAPDVEITALPYSLYDPRSTDAILGADALVGCTDNEGSRLHLNHIAVQHLLPYIDCGVGIERKHDGLVVGGQVRVVLPGGPCLECYGGIDRWRAARDLESSLDRDRRHAHGYGLGDGVPAPALAILNASIAAEAATSVVALATGLRPLVPYVAYDLLQTRLAPRTDVVRSPGCPTCAVEQRYGRGDRLPLPVPDQSDQLPVRPRPQEVHP